MSDETNAPRSTVFGTYSAKMIEYTPCKYGDPACPCQTGYMRQQARAEAI